MSLCTFFFSGGISTFVGQTLFSFQKLCCINIEEKLGLQRCINKIKSRPNGRNMFILP